MRTVHVRPGAPPSTVILDFPQPSNPVARSSANSAPPAFLLRAIEQGVVWALVAAIAFTCVVIREEASKLPLDAPRPAEVQR